MIHAISIHDEDIFFKIIWNNNRYRSRFSRLKNSNNRYWRSNVYKLHTTSAVFIIDSNQTEF